VVPSRLPSRLPTEHRTNQSPATLEAAELALVTVNGSNSRNRGRNKDNWAFRVINISGLISRR
jgi:hypothetical protein